ncbi:uncharacterized protein zgc:194930 [Alosa sapidissima]|uniref:uncharacterized protein zgc:194930 n=1 Tax=Alosa sapidissima TaxID=34773 RepID=UPI001C0A542F|nr:uncharacterized protein zgc:194930 [Alosa sapidissima]
MGCNCCRMIKSYIYDPSVPVDVHGRKRDLPGSSLYVPHLQEPEDSDRLQKKQGFYNLGYSNSGGVGSGPNRGADGNTKLDIENNHINRLHGNSPPAGNANPEWTGVGKGGGGGGGRGGGTDPDILGTPQHKEQPTLRYAPPLPSVPPIYQLPSSGGPTRPWDRELLSGNAVTRIEPYILQDRLDGVECCVDGRKDPDDDDDERESGVGSTPEYLGDTGDEASVLSGDINTSSTSLSSADTRPGTGDDRRGQREVDGREDRDDCQSVTDSMVAEALAALEAATAGEDCD